eukprot:907987-Prymnesium_polylepis.1
MVSRTLPQAQLARRYARRAQSWTLVAQATGVTRTSRHVPISTTHHCPDTPRYACRHREHATTVHRAASL